MAIRLSWVITLVVMSFSVPLQKGCEINRKDGTGNMPLSYAVQGGHDSCCLTLMQKGADISGDVITNPTADVPPTRRAKEDGEEDDEYYHTPGMSA